MRFTLGDVLQTAATRWPDRCAIHVAGETPITYGQLWEQANRVAAALRTRHPEAAHVGIVGANSARWLACLYGATLAGRTAVLLNPRLTDSELGYQIEQSDCQMMLAGPESRRGDSYVFNALASSNADVPVVWTGTAAHSGAWPWDSWLDIAPERQTATRRVGERDTAVIIYTSGTTAQPKGVMLAHGSVVRNAYIVGRNLGITSGDSVFAAGPFFHSGGLTMHVVMAAVFGVPAYSVPAFDPDGVLDFVEWSRPTLYNGIETLFLRLTDTPRFDRGRVASVRTGWATGTPAVLHTIANDMGMPGVVGMYGISEASPNVTLSPWHDTPEHRLDTIGRPQPWTQVGIWDPDRGMLTEPDVVGELTVRGYGVMQGYYRKPGETAEALRDGWLHTGDLARMRPDGYLEFAGRMKDIVRVGGENVSCAEVEDAVYGLGGIELAAVLAADDRRYGQVPVAVVKAADSVAPPPEEELISQLRATLSGHKLPRRVLVRDHLPLTETGKVHKGRLRADVLTSLEDRS